MYLSPESANQHRLPRGAVYFWDPLLAKPTSPLSSPKEDPRLKSHHPTRLTFIEHLRQYPNTVGKNHYKGDRVYENFGYVRDRDTDAWIDPDASGLLKDEYLFCGYRGWSDDAYETYVPDFQRTQRTRPRVMNRQEQDQFYKEYTEYVHDEVDVEGDPRNLRITPAIFARWAEGARKADHYEEETFTPVCGVFVSILSSSLIQYF